MEKRLAEAAKRLNPLKRFRQAGCARTLFERSGHSQMKRTKWPQWLLKLVALEFTEEFEQKAAAKKALQEIQNKLNS